MTLGSALGLDTIMHNRLSRAHMFNILSIQIISLAFEVFKLNAPYRMTLTSIFESSCSGTQGYRILF